MHNERIIYVMRAGIYTNTLSHTRTCKCISFPLHITTLCRPVTANQGFSVFSITQGPFYNKTVLWVSMIYIQKYM